MPSLEDTVAVHLPGDSGGVLHQAGNGLHPAIWAHQRPDGQYRILIIETDADVTWDGSTASLDGIVLPSNGEMTITVTTLILPEWNDDMLTALQQELSS